MARTRTQVRETVIETNGNGTVAEPAAKPRRTRGTARGAEAATVEAMAPGDVVQETLAVHGEMLEAGRETLAVQGELLEAGRQSLQEMGRQWEAMQAQLGEARQQLAEIGPQVTEAQAQILALRGLRQEVLGTLNEFRRDALAVQSQILVDLQEGGQRLRTELGGTGAHTEAFQRLVREAGDRLKEELNAQISHLRQELEGLRHALQDLPLAAIRQELAEAHEYLRHLPLGQVRREIEETREALEELPRQAEEIRQRQEELLVRIPEAVPAVPAPVAVEAPAHRNRLGITVDPGVVVTEVLAGTPAEAAQLALGDVIRAVNGLAVVNAVELRDAIQGAKGGDTVTLQVVRGGAVQDVKAQLDAAIPDEAVAGRNWLGVTVDPGVVVAEVQPGSPAALAGLVPGDVIRSVNGTGVATGEQVKQLVQHLTENAEIRLLLARAGEDREVQVRMEDPAVELVTTPS